MSLLRRSVPLIDIARGANHWRYACANKDHSYAGIAYEHAAIKVGKIAESEDLARNTLDLAMPQNLGVLDAFRHKPVLAPMSAMVLRYYPHDESADVTWSGTVGGVTWATHTATMHCLPPMASMQAQGLKRAWQKQCPHVLYSAGPGLCNASRTAVKTTATITKVTGNTIHAAAFAAQDDGWWTGGYIEWNHGTDHEVRFIDTHAGDACTLLTAPGLTVGTVVTAYPGCDHTLDTCHSKFDNAANFGGQPWIPEKNPMGPDNIY